NWEGHPEWVTYKSQVTEWIWRVVRWGLWDQTSPGFPNRLSKSPSTRSPRRLVGHVFPKCCEIRPLFGGWFGAVIQDRSLLRRRPHWSQPVHGPAVERHVVVKRRNRGVLPESAEGDRFAGGIGWEDELKVILDSVAVAASSPGERPGCREPSLRARRCDAD